MDKSFRLLTTKEGETIDDMIKKKQYEIALAFCELTLEVIENEIVKLRENIREIKKELLKAKLNEKVKK